MTGPALGGALGQTITIVNQSGKVVKSSKTLVNVFKEARSAYRERKAEIKAERRAALEEKRARQAMKGLTLNGEDDRHTRVSRHPPAIQYDRPPIERGYSDGYSANNYNLYGQPLPHYQQDLVYERPGELTRRHTEGGALKRQSWRSSSDSTVDMDLAYGDMPPPLPQQHMEDEEELREKMSKITMLLDEAHCLHHSVTSVVDHLQKNPDALAAVALTLAEISNLWTKMSPGVLTALKSSFPSVVALLASPQFAIAAGVGVGVTIVMLGGYRVIKKIAKAKGIQQTQMGPMPVFEEPEPILDELQEKELSSIEIWRRGIADAEAESIGTTVDGEFITPLASRQLIDAGVLDEDELKSRRGGKSRKAKSESGKTVRSERSARTEKTYKTSKTHKTERTERTERIDRTERAERSHVGERDRGTIVSFRDDRSEASHRSHRTHRSHRDERSEASHRSHRSHRDDQSEASHRSHRSHRSSKSERTERSERTEKGDKKKKRKEPSGLRLLLSTRSHAG